jgi:hypothetical protein
MINFSDILSSMIYYNAHNYIKDKVHEKHLNNIISTIHVISTCILCFFYFQLNTNNTLYLLIATNSKGFYLYDSIHIYIKLNKNFSILNLIYIYHHLTSINTFAYDPILYKWIYILYIVEIANLPTKIVYYLIKEEKIKNKKFIMTNIMKIIQLIFYIYVRVYIVSFEYFNLFYTVEDNTPLLISFPLYIIGLIWTYSIYKSIKFDELSKLKLI